MKSSTRSRVPPLCCCFFFCEKEASCNGNYISSNLASFMMIPSVLQHSACSKQNMQFKDCIQAHSQIQEFPIALCTCPPLSLSHTSEYMVHCTQDAMHVPSTPLSLLQSDHTAAAAAAVEAAKQSATLDWLQPILSIKEERRSISKSCRYPMPLSIGTFL